MTRIAAFPPVVWVLLLGTFLIRTAVEAAARIRFLCASLRRPGFAAGFVTYAFLPAQTYLGWIAGTWILSMGEAVLFPTLNLQVDRMAPSHLKGSYFGASALGGLGFSLGPLVGGFLLQYIGGPGTFVMTALITGVGGLSYWKSSRVADRNHKLGA